MPNNLIISCLIKKCYFNIQYNLKGDEDVEYYVTINARRTYFRIPFLRLVPRSILLKLLIAGVLCLLSNSARLNRPAAFSQISSAL